MYDSLKRTKDFKRIYNKNTRISGRYFTLLVYPDEALNLEIGIVASKKIGNAVKRNKVKRRVRAFLRENIEIFNGLKREFIIISRYSVAKATWKDVYDDLTDLFARFFKKTKVYADSK